MSKRNETIDRQIIERYTDQPVRMPVEVRSAIEGAWGGRPVQLYALADLDAGMRLSEAWLALGDQALALAHEHDGEWVVTSVPRSRVTALRETPGLSGSALTFLGEPNDPALMLVRYTHRQKRAMENVRFVVEQELKGDEVPVADADAEYAGAVAGPIQEAQALVAGNQAAVLWRLLGYLGRYRRQVVLGFTAATLITAVSLVPPYLAGFLIDSVVRPVQDGVLSVERGSRVAWIAVGAMVLVYLVRQASALERWCWSTW